MGSTRGIRGWIWNACIFMNIDEASMGSHEFCEFSIDIGVIENPQYFHEYSIFLLVLLSEYTPL